MHKYKKFCLLSLVFLMGLSTFLFADDKDVALVLKTAGKVELKPAARGSWLKAKRGQRLNSGQAVRTGDGSLAALVFTDDKSFLKVRSNSNVTINGKREKKSIVKRITLAFGQIWAKVTKQNTAMRVEAPSGVATVKGTTFSCLYNSQEEFVVFCQSGLLEVVNRFGTMLLGTNQMARLRSNAPPERLSGNPADLFELEDDGGARQLEIELEKDGEKRKLIMDFGGNE